MYRDHRKKKLRKTIKGKKYLRCPTKNSDEMYLWTISRD
jgi:hypothetical protein